MTLLVFGRTGQVATELQALAPVMALGRAEADLLDPEACVAAIRAHAPHAVFNAAAFTAVDRAEEEEALATLINGETPAAMARACTEAGIPFIHISTDHVFDGSGERPWRSDDTTDPQNAYGRSKLAGERGVVAAGGRYAILRTSWVFSVHGTNFVKTMLRLSETRDALNIVADQTGGPTPAHDIAAACLSIAEQLTEDASRAGIYHLSGAPDVSWYGFAREIFDRAGRRITVTPIPTSAYRRPACRPLNSRMDCSATQATFGIARPNWRAGLDAVLAGLGVTADRGVQKRTGDEET